MRTTFEGPVKSNGGFEIGQSNSVSSVSGTLIFSTGSTIQLQNVNLNVSSATITSLNTTTTQAVNLCLCTTTAANIRIGNAYPGWERGGINMNSTPGSTMLMNMDLGSVFAATGCNGTNTVYPSGGYLGQLITLYMSTGATAASIVFGPGSGITMCSIGNVTSGQEPFPIAATSAHALAWVRLNETEMALVSNWSINSAFCVSQKGTVGTGIVL